MQTNKTPVKEENEALLNYILKHYWDFASFRALDYVYSSEFTDRLKNFAWLLHSSTDDIAIKSIKLLLTKAICHKEAFRQIILQLDKIHNEKSSLMSNETRGIYILEQASFAMMLTEDEQTKYKQKMKLILLNRKGTKAHNLELFNTQNEKFEMVDIQCEYLLLYFFSPSESSCKMSTIFLQRNPVASVWRNEGRLKILAIYTDKDEALWSRFARSEDKWIHGWDMANNIRKKKLYDLSIIPSLYLLNRDKKVVLKNCTIEQLTEFLEKNIQ